MRALADGLTALDALPRGDTFWSGWANDHPTVHKLSDYAREQIRRDPMNRTARWALVALELAHGANDGGLSLLGPEIAADPAAVADAFVIADWVAQEIGFDLLPELRDACSWADPHALETLAQTDHGDAARRAIRTLQEQPPGRGLSR